MKKARTSSESSAHGIIVSGEASESEEDDIDIKFTEESGFTCLDQNFINKDKKINSCINRKNNSKRKDLLQQKLYESNIALHKRITSELEDPVIEGSKKIVKLDAKISSVYNHTKNSTLALRKATGNVDVILNKLSTLNYSHLPTKKS